RRPPRRPELDVGADVRLAPHDGSAGRRTGVSIHGRVDDRADPCSGGRGRARSGWLDLRHAVRTTSSPGRSAPLRPRAAGGRGRPVRTTGPPSGGRSRVATPEQEELACSRTSAGPAMAPRPRGQGHDPKESRGLHHLLPNGERGRIMRRMISGGLVAAGLLLAVGPATAQDLVQLQNDPNQWVLPGKNYAGTRFSELDQINTQNVKDLKVAWTFSTGTLNGLEGAPLVVNNTMYFVTSFPNIVYALDLTKPGAPIKWMYKPNQDPTVQGVACCDVVN